MAGAGVPLASLFFGRQQWFPPTKIGRSRAGPFQFHFQGKRDFWWSLWVNTLASFCHRMARQLWTGPTDPHLYRERGV